MSELKGKIDFLMLITVKDANPNGDPLNGNRPRENFDGLEKFPMYVSKGKSETGGRIWDREFSYSRTIEKMTGSEA